MKRVGTNFAAIVVGFASMTLMSFTVSAAPLRLMALGDSITRGANGASPTADPSAGGYRPILGARFTGTPIEWLGRGIDGPPDARFHEGHNGFTIRQIDNQIVDPAFDALGTVRPDVVLLMIGTNDVWNPIIYNDPLTTRERMLINLRTLLLHIHDRAPDSRIVVSTITPMGFPNDVIETARQVYNNGIPVLLQDLQGDGINCGMVNAGGRVTPNLLPDGVHPNTAGYQLIAEGFYDAFMLPATPEPATASVLVLFLAVLSSHRRRYSAPRAFV